MENNTAGNPDIHRNNEGTATFPVGFSGVAVIRRKAFNKKTYRKIYYHLHRNQELERVKKWREANPEKAKLGRLKWYYAHKEQGNVNHKKWKKAHPEEVKEFYRKWRLAHPEQVKENSRKYRELHREIINKKNKEYKKTPKGKARDKKYNATQKGKERKRKSKARRKQFGFIPLNKPFEGSRGHHINRTYVIYIPTKMHEDNRHSLLRNRGMKKINKLAYKFLEAGREAANETCGKQRERNAILPAF